MPSSRSLRSLGMAAAAVGGTLTLWSRRGVPDLAGQTVVVTGASRGLGYLLAREFGRRGCAVAVCARDPERLARAEDSLRAEGIKVYAQPCDVGVRAEVERFLDAAVRTLGPIDILVNNAGVIQVGPLEALTIDDFDDARRTMFDGVLHTTLCVLPRMLERRNGRIVNITSIGGRLGVPHLLPYVAAKFAATGFSEALRAELAGTRVSVTTISPGLMRTGSHLNAEFAGRTQEEARWFGLGATLPGISIGAERAARQIVDAAARREAARTLTVPPTLGAKAHGLAPGLVARVFALADRYMLPPHSASSRRERGAVALDRGGRLLQTVTTLGRNAGHQLLQYPIYPVARAEESPPQAPGELATA